MMGAMSYTGLRERLRRREPLTVAFLDLGSPVSAELTARSGFDVVVVDLEHGAGDEGAARAQIQAAEPHAAVVVRGISPFSRGNRFGQAGPDFRAQADAALACIVQIERASALEAVDAIAALPDVDALLMGPADLSADLGCELDLAGAHLSDAARRISEAAERHGKTAALHIGHADQAPGFRELGFTMLSCTFESAVLAAASAAAANDLRTGAALSGSARRAG